MRLRSRRELALIDAEICRIEDSIVLLVRQRAQLKRKRNSFSSAINLPSEIIARIFEFACMGGPGEVYQETNSIPGASNLGMSTGPGAVTPIFLSTICSAWRKIALSSSQLWNKITIHLDEKHATSQAAQLRRWLERTRRRSLWVTIVEDVSNEDSDEVDNSWGLETTSTAVIDVLCSYASQWHTMDLFLPSSWKISLSRIRHNLPNLSSLKLRVSEGSPCLAAVDTFALAPHLQDVVLVGYSVSDVVLPWHQLERLEGEFINVGESLEMLGLCPSLRKYQFRQQYKGILPFTSAGVIHERLESFEIIIDSALELRALLEALSLPNLKELVVSVSEEQSVLPHIVSLLRRSGCAKSLRRLHLVGLMPEEEDLVDCLWQLPSLEALLLINPVMTGGKLTEHFMELMNPFGSDGVSQGGSSCGWRDGDVETMDVECENRQGGALFLPRLTKFEYQGRLTFSNHCMVKMMASRWNIVYLNEPAVDYPTPPPSSNMSFSFLEAPWVAPRAPVARLNSVIFTTERYFRFVEEDAKVIQNLVQAGMHLEFIRYLC